MGGGGIRVKHMSGSNGLSAALAFYAPGGRQARHDHDYTQISFLLSGEMRERHGEREWTPPGPSIGLKPPGLAHDNEWGADGALIFCLKLSAARTKDFAVGEQPGWRPVSSPYVPQLVRSCVDAGPAIEQNEAILDLIAAVHLPRAAAKGCPPPWLSTARAGLREAPASASVSQIAASAGVHRVHFSTEFTRFYGMPPSLYRRQALISRAVAKIALSDLSLTSIAHDEGFSDQAHLTRSVLGATGLTPGRLRIAIS